MAVMFHIYIPIKHNTGSLQSSSVPLPQAVLSPAASSALCEEVERPPLVEVTVAPGCCFLRQSAAEQQQCRFSKQADPATQSGTSAQKNGRKGRKMRQIITEVRYTKVRQLVSCCRGRGILSKVPLAMYLKC